MFLLRHGETESNKQLRYVGREESPLTEQGKKEAALLAQALKEAHFSVIYSSPLSRSKETANILSTFHPGVEIIEDKRLVERDYGLFEGKTFEQLRTEYSDLYKKWLLHPAKTAIPNAETLEAVQKRGSLAIDNIINKHQGKNICVVGHGGINRIILFQFLGLGLDNFFRIKQDNCCINIIEFDEYGPMIMLLNSTSFIAERRILMQDRY